MPVGRDEENQVHVAERWWAGWESETLALSKALGASPGHRRCSFCSKARMHADPTLGPEMCSVQCIALPFHRWTGALDWEWVG